MRDDGSFRYVRGDTAGDANVRPESNIMVRWSYDYRWWEVMVAPRIVAGGHP